jgi:hypothetical protein
MNCLGANQDCWTAASISVSIGYELNFRGPRKVRVETISYVVIPLHIQYIEFRSLSSAISSKCALTTMSLHPEALGTGRVV